ncbi:hypothetical protein C5F49_02465 [Nitrosopumilus oxyclinae]|uniref:Peptidase n=1 Tax=Nitrosopumilus oxyclinae TaxID=1959104 RepID=A0A7D5RDK0_9ARCH|nr:hypothetical protein [Nitrosopumilus oxyclinae]QLH04305.1 hypothetical protein C5F49_02465 [Nitrosopumilus oxyclinae]
MIFKPLFVLTAALFLVSFNLVYAEASLYDILDYDVGYDIENGEILVMNLDVDSTSLIIEIVSFDDGFIELNIPRGLIDATFDDEDDIFFVLIDGTESDYLEINSADNTRTLIIPFYTNDQEIEILGTSVLSATPTTVEIPSWVKNNAGWWSGGLLEDSDFVAGLNYMITNGIIVIPPTEAAETVNKEIPSWVKNNAGWWSEGLLEDSDFIAGIQYMISNGILVI